MNRRWFLGAASAAGLAGQTRISANDQIHVAMIGVGGRGRALTNAVVRIPGAKIVHLCDVDQANLERASKMVTDAGAPAPQLSADMRRALDDKNVHAVFVSTPDHWHAPATILACDAGKDVYVEKPASHNLREGRLMVDAARRNQRIVQLGTQSRSRPSIIRAVDYVQSGKIGRVLMAKAWNIQLRKNIGRKPDGPVPPGVDYENWLGAAPWIPFNENRFHYNWHWHWHFGTGDIGNDGAHQIDIARWALGVSTPTAVSGMGRKYFFDDDQQTPDTMNLTFDYGDKALLWEMRIWTPYPLEEIDNGVAVYGTEGQVHIGRWNRRWGFKVFDGDGKLTHHDNPDPKDDNDEHHQRNFFDCMRTRKLPNADIGIGHLSCVPCHLGNIVARTGRNLRFHAESEEVLGDSEANQYIARRYRTHWSTPKML